MRMPMIIGDRYIYRTPSGIDIRCTLREKTYGLYALQFDGQTSLTIVLGDSKLRSLSQEEEFDLGDLDDA